MATVAEPMETRTTAASSQASTSGGMCAPSARRDRGLGRA
jgi:hypothetical protein